MLIQSSVGEWVDMIKALPADKRHVSGKGDQGDYRYRITPSRTEVPNFLLRMGGNAEIHLVCMLPFSFLDYSVVYHRLCQVIRY